jgi:endoglucanase
VTGRLGGWLLSWGALALLVGCALGGPAGKAPSPAQADALAAQTAALGRGVNLGNALEAPREGEWGLTLQEGYFRAIAEAGFDSVRIPIRWNAHAALEPPYAIAWELFARVDWAIEQALANDLAVVINIHHYDALMADPEGQRERFLALWRQIAEHYAGYDERLYFELLNEPHDRLQGKVWNEYLAEALGVVRESNPDRWVIVGPDGWNHVGALPGLRLPEEDRRLIVTFHYYEPFAFTHQGAEWVQRSDPWLGRLWHGTESELRAIRRDFDAAVHWAVERERPVYLGEFGAYSRADMASRVRWTAAVAREAEARGFAWAYWEFGAGFGIYDPVRGAWREELLRALLPEE